MLAAGLGKRMAPLTPGVPKPLLPVAGRSILHRVLDAMAGAAVTDCVVVTHHEAGQVEAAVKAWTGAMKVRCVPQGEPKGTGHAIAAGAAHVKGDAIVAMGDGLADPAAFKAIAARGGFVVGAAKVADPRRYGCLVVEGDKVTDLAEKPDVPPSDLANTGIYRVPAQALADTMHLKPSPRGELEFTDVVRAWAHAGKVTWTTVAGWLDVGAPWDLLTAQEALLPATLDKLLGKASSGGEGTIEPGVQLRGRLFVSAGAIVKSGTYIEGDVWIGPNAKVGPNAYLRGPTCIGAKCHVGAATELKASLLMDGANAPHLNYVGDSVLGPDVNLGAGTVVANLKVTPGNVRAMGPSGLLDTGRRKFGTAIGPGAKLGIGVSINPGTLVGADVLVGAGKVLQGWVEPGSRVT